MASATKWLSLLALLASGVVSQVGCRACGTCYDYAPPVADCQCQACGCGHGRSGSVLTHFAGGEVENAAAIAAQPEIGGPIRK